MRGDVAIAVEHQHRRTETQNKSENMSCAAPRAAGQANHAENQSDDRIDRRRRAGEQPADGVRAKRDERERKRNGAAE